MLLPEGQESVFVMYGKMDSLSRLFHPPVVPFLFY